MCRGNNAADSLAQHAFANQPALLDTWEQLRLEISNLEHIRKWTHNTLIRVGHLTMDKLKEQNRCEEEEKTEANHTQLPYVQWFFPETLDTSLKSYDIPEWRDIHLWVNSLHQEGETMYLSWYQLFADFTMSYPDKGPFYKASSKRWKGGTDRPDTHFAQKARWMATYLTKLSKQIELDLPTKHCRPFSFTMAFWSACLPVRMTSERHQRLETWLRTFRALYRRPKDFEFMNG